MKTSTALDRVVGTSHRRLFRADLYDDTDTLVDSLPVQSGAIVGSAVDIDRWTATLDLAGDEWVPVEPSDPLSGLSRHYLRLHAGAEVDTADTLVEVCRVIPVTTRARVSVDAAEITTTCLGLHGWMGTLSGDWTPTASETCQAMIGRIVTSADPPGWTGTTTDTTTPVAVPSDYEGGDNAAAVVEDLAAIANVAVFFDADGDLVIRDPLDTTLGTPTFWLDTETTVTEYDLEVGREYGFANRVELTFRKPDGTEVVGTAEVSSGDLAPSACGLVTYTDTRDGNVSQTVADNRAQALLDAAVLAWQTIAVQAVPDPRLEPDDVVGVDLSGRRRYARVTTVELPVSPADPMRVGLRVDPQPIPPGLTPAVDLYPATDLYPSGG